VATSMVRQIPLLDLVAQHRTIRDEVLAEITRVVDSQKFILGEDVEQLEKSIAEYSQARFAIGCASGSDALFLALLALGVGAGDEVLTTPYTFFATVGAIVRAGATPVFVDIDPQTFNMNPEQVPGALSAHPKVKAVIPIHLFGACADMDPIRSAASERCVAVIEDAAQSIGAEYKGRRSGTLADLACFSFFPSKNLGGYGDGGMLATNNQELAEKLRMLRVHGTKKKYIHEYVGINSRLDALQAAILRVKLRHLDGWTLGRQNNAERYRQIFREMQIPVTAPIVPSTSTRHVYNQFVIRCERRDELQAHLKSCGIGSEIYYPVPMHVQACFSNLGYREGDFPASEACAKDSLALPIHSELTGEHLDHICRSIRSFYL
jgi:dTDP-4-amino-4,6-dideoxygalactose transaminase